MLERILETDIARYEWQIRHTRDERQLRKLRQLLVATQERLAVKREQRQRGFDGMKQI